MATAAALTVHGVVQYAVHGVVHNTTICEPYSGQMMSGAVVRAVEYGARLPVCEPCPMHFLGAQQDPLTYPYTNPSMDAGMFFQEIGDYADTD